ncbi:hypothetical protein [Curtobacterium sp. 314Chir4.1]|uniref:hypothetical protein n=1 Tax=Curtobacterium sp. 314Chir4.1 TaxID=1279028 RepID=UPI001143FF08|nr:hypothetical protein [Curtobacterium sp. 314Chir4.1]
MNEPHYESHTPHWMRIRIRHGDRRLETAAVVAALAGAAGGVVAGFASLAVHQSDMSAVGTFVRMEVLLNSIWICGVAVITPWLGVGPGRRFVLATAGAGTLLLLVSTRLGPAGTGALLVGAGSALILVGVAWWTVAGAVATAAHRSCWLAVSGAHAACGVVLIGFAQLHDGEVLVLAAGTYVWLGVGTIAAVCMSRLRLGDS